MKPGNIPENYADILCVAQKAQMVTWWRDLGSNRRVLNIYCDDHTVDRRTVIEARLDSEKAGAVSVRTLCGFDPKKNRWASFCSPAGTVSMPDRRGMKALIEWVQARSTEVTGSPGSLSFSYYKGIKS